MLDCGGKRIGCSGRWDRAGEGVLCSGSLRCLRIRFWPGRLRHARARPVGADHSACKYPCLDSFGSAGHDGTNHMTIGFNGGRETPHLDKSSVCSALLMLEAPAAIPFKGSETQPAKSPNRRNVPPPKSLLLLLPQVLLATKRALLRHSNSSKNPQACNVPIQDLTDGLTREGSSPVLLQVPRNIVTRYEADLTVTTCRHKTCLVSW